MAEGAPGSPPQPGLSFLDEPCPVTATYALSPRHVSREFWASALQLDLSSARICSSPVLLPPPFAVADRDGLSTLQLNGNGIPVAAGARVGVYIHCPASYINRSFPEELGRPITADPTSQLQVRALG